MLIAPPVLILLLRLTLPSTSPGADWVACIAAGLLGLAGVAIAPWREPAKVAIAGVYMAVALVLMPFIWVATALAL